MGGRGRGRGGGGARAAMSFNVEELGFRRGDALPVSQLAPPPLFPTLAQRPPPLDVTDELDYLQALKEEFRTTMRNSPHFLRADEVKNSVERYSDRFKKSTDEGAQDEEEERHLWFMPDSFFPDELNDAPKKKKKKTETGKRKLKGNVGDIASKLDELEKKEGEGEDEEDEEEAAAAAKKKKQAKKENADGAEGEEDEEEEEEGDDGDEEEEEMGGNDYEQNYFDNGEDDANSSEDNLDEGGTY